jgi:diguanylate cyclase (GGDEF)-like protein
MIILTLFRASSPKDSEYQVLSFVIGRLLLGIGVTIGQCAAGFMQEPHKVYGYPDDKLYRMIVTANSWRQRLERCSTLPTLPSVAMKVLQLCQEEELSFNKISETIGKDPALVVKVLKMVNSPIYGMRHEVVKLSQALGLLGVNAVRGLVLSFSLPRPGNKGGGLANYWRRSVISAIAAKEICGESRNEQREEAFLGALLQDIGILAVARVVGDRYDQLLATAAGDHEMLAQLERDEIGADHVEVGTWLLNRWRVPASLVQMVRGSHNPTLVEEGASDETCFLVNAVAMSGRFADIWVYSDAAVATASLQQLNETIFGARPLDVDMICQRLLAALPQVASFLDVQLDVQEMAAVLEEAQEALVIAMAELESSTASLRQEAQQDHLTGIPNRGQLEAHFTKEFEDAISKSQRLGVIFADVDRFKSVNDTYGHSAGDSVLQSVSQILSNGLRKRDFVGRYGGEEFVILLPGAGETELQIVAERLRARVEASDHPIGDGRSLRVTVSLGCASIDAKRHLHPKDLIDEADGAMYAAKQAGRNRIVFSRRAPIVAIPSTREKSCR